MKIYNTLIVPVLVISCLVSGCMGVTDTEVPESGAAQSALPYGLWHSPVNPAHPELLESYWLIQPNKFLQITFLGDLPSYANDCYSIHEVPYFSITSSDIIIQDIYTFTKPYTLVEGNLEVGEIDSYDYDGDEDRTDLFYRVYSPSYDLMEGYFTARVC